MQQDEGIPASKACIFPWRSAQWKKNVFEVYWKCSVNYGAPGVDTGLRLCPCQVYSDLLGPGRAMKQRKNRSR